MTTVRFGVAIAVLLGAVSAASHYQEFRLPSDEEIGDLPSLDPEDREELHDYVADTMDNYYQYKHYEAMGEKYDRDAIALFDRVITLDKEIPREIRRQSRVPLHPEHDPWLFEAMWELMEQERWGVLSSISLILSSHVEAHPERTNLAMYLLEQPIGKPNPTKAPVNHRSSVRLFAGTLYLLGDWPENTARTMAALVTLPHQPDDRVIRPPYPHADAERVAETEERIASNTMDRLERFATPEQLAEVASYIEAEVEAGAFELDAETEEWLESIRQ